MGLVLNAVVAAIAVVVAACLATHEGSVSVARAVNASQGGRKVVVVGGGIGGLVAAHRLRQQGVDVTILEARYKMGGRVWTHRGWGGHPIDVGATFIHGVEGNPLTALAEEFKQPVVKVDYSKMKVYGSGGARIGADAIRTTKELYRLLRKQVMRTRDSLYKDIPLQESFEKAYAKVTAPSGSGEPSSRLLRGKDEVEAMSWHFFWEVVQDQIAELRALSTVEFDASTAFAGHDYVMGNGMQSLTDAVASAATAAGVAAHVNCTVVQVAHTGSSYMVACADKRSFEADEVVVALPLGVMQKGSVAFDPPLPKWKRRSIHRLGCSAAVKMALHFPSAFWDSDAQFIGKVSATNQTMWGDGAHMEFINMNAFHSGSNVLVLEVDVEHAKAVNAMAWEERVAHVMRALRTIYGEAIPEPDDVKMANFVGDPLVGCGFSYWPPFVSGDDNLEAAESVHGNTLHFIGEYTSPLYYGNLHGAVDEAEKLAQRFASRSMADVFSAVVAPVAAVFSPPSTRGHGKVKKRFVPQWCPAPCQVN